MRVGITGHRGLGADVGRSVREMIVAAVRAYDAAELVGVSCIADGPDAWFAEAVVEHGGRLEVVVPAVGYRDALPEWHHATFDACWGSVRHPCDRDGRVDARGAHGGLGDPGGPVRRTPGGVGRRAARGFGGTADVVAYAERHGTPVRILWPEGATR